MIFAVSNPKGGAGKSTLVLTLATYLAQQGASVCVIDTDPNHCIVDWDKKNESMLLKVLGEVKEDSLRTVLDEVVPKYQFVFIDLEGTANLLVSRAIMAAHMVLIPVQATSYHDARQAGRAINLVKETEQWVRDIDPKRSIPFRVVLVRTPAPGAPVSLYQRKMEKELTDQGIPRFSTHLAERMAYKLMWETGLTVAGLTQTPGAGNVETAAENLHQLTNELIEWASEISGNREGNQDDGEASATNSLEPQAGVNEQGG